MNDLTSETEESLTSASTLTSDIKNINDNAYASAASQQTISPSFQTKNKQYHTMIEKQVRDQESYPFLLPYKCIKKTFNITQNTQDSINESCGLKVISN